MNPSLLRLVHSLEESGMFSGEWSPRSLMNKVGEYLGVEFKADNEEPFNFQTSYDGGNQARRYYAPGWPLRGDQDPEPLRRLLRSGNFDANSVWVSFRSWPRFNAQHTKPIEQRNRILVVEFHNLPEIASTTSLGSGQQPKVTRLLLGLENLVRRELQEQLSPMELRSVRSFAPGFDGFPGVLFHVLIPLPAPHPSKRSI